MGEGGFINMRWRLSMGYPWMSRILFGLSCEDFNQTNINALFVRVFVDFEVFQFLVFICCLVYIFNFIFVGTVGHQGLFWGQLGPPGTILVASYVLVTFQGISKP